VVTPKTSFDAWHVVLYSKVRPSPSCLDLFPPIDPRKREFARHLCETSLTHLSAVMFTCSFFFLMDQFMMGEHLRPSLPIQFAPLERVSTFAAPVYSPFFADGSSRSPLHPSDCCPVFSSCRSSPVTSYSPPRLLLALLSCQRCDVSPSPLFPLFPSFVLPLSPFSNANPLMLPFHSNSCGLDETRRRAGAGLRRHFFSTVLLLCPMSSGFCVLECAF